MTGTSANSAHGVIAIGAQTTFSHHRCGWGYAIEALRPEDDEAGIPFYGFLDGLFNRAINPAYDQTIPLRTQWTGFFHNPPSMPAWFPDEPRLSRILKEDDVRRSMENCVGLFTLSEHLAKFLRAETGVATSSLYYPTEIPESLFSYEAFLANPQKRVVSIGWWLRRKMSIFYLPLDNQTPYRKARLNCGDLIETSSRAMSRLEFVNDWRNRKLENRFRDNTEELPYLPNDAFDRLVSKNIVYLDVYDASANNTVVECIARATPLIVNRIPPIVEYLGPDYPLYYETLEEAATKALDFDAVKLAHDYLLTCPVRARLSQQVFLNDFRNSEVFRRLRASHCVNTTQPVPELDP